MPIYEYECTRCGTQLEVTQRMSDPPLKRCEPCGEDSLQKLMSRSAFQLKGGGWYSDLYSSTKKETKTPDAPAATSSSTTTAAPASAPAAASSGSTTASA